MTGCAKFDSRHGVAYQQPCHRVVGTVGDRQFRLRVVGRVASPSTLTSLFLQFRDGSL